MRWGRFAFGLKARQVTDRLRFDPAVRGDLLGIVSPIADFAGPAVAESKLAEIKNVARSLTEIPKRGTIRNEIAEVIRAIPAGRKGGVVFRVNDKTRSVLVLAISNSGADWIGCTGERI